MWSVSTAALQGRIIRIEWEKPQQIGDGAYELRKGRAFYAVDPKSELNSVVMDLDLAPKDEKGLVHFSGEISLQYPSNSESFSGLSWVHVPNRGGMVTLSKDQMQRGLAMLNVGWEFDLPEGADKLRLTVPQAKNLDGSPIRGRVTETFVVDRPTNTRKLSDLWLYPMVPGSESERKLVLRDRSAFPEGTTLKNEDWELVDGEIRSKQDLVPGKTYEVSYIAQNPYVGGLGYVAVRDAVMWLKHGKSTPIKVKHAVAFGSSQCGRFLRDFLYLGFNQMENGRPAFHGVVAHVAGAGRLVLNQRWSKPKSIAAYDTSSFPFSDRAQLDPVTGKWEGVLENKRARFIPKLFYINTSSEYWGAGRAAGLVHSHVEGISDEILFAQVRSYFYSGTQHGAASFPPPRIAEDGLYTNPMNANEITEALRYAMEEWVMDGKLPPESVYPTLKAGTLTLAKEVKFPAIPGLAMPSTLQAGPRIENPQLSSKGGKGAPLPLLVPQVDEDGNDLGGIRMPELEAPLATATGWIYRPKSMGETHELALLRGFWIPFPQTKAQREKNGDPRLSIEERYSSKTDFLRRIEKAAKRLVEQRFLLETQVPLLLKRAEKQWDWIQNSSAK